jgi:hypothetical protein
VLEAARVLGISERAVRKRITANTLAATRTATGWLVELAAVPRAVPAALVDELRHQRDALEATVVDLRARLDGAEQAQAELRRLLALALQTRALPEPRDTPTESGGEPTEPSSHPWWARWAWWRR